MRGSCQQGVTPPTTPTLSRAAADHEAGNEGAMDAADHEAGNKGQKQWATMDKATMDAAELLQSFRARCSEGDEGACQVLKHYDSEL